jgi:hypothetical protein
MFRNEHWRVLNKLPEPIGPDQDIDKDSCKAIKETSYMIFTRLTQGTGKVLCDLMEVPSMNKGP